MEQTCPEGVKNGFIKIFQKDNPTGLFFGQSVPEGEKIKVLMVRLRWKKRTWNSWTFRGHHLEDLIAFLLTIIDMKFKFMNNNNQKENEILKIVISNPVTDSVIYIQ